MSTRPRRAKTQTLPPPVGGWNTRDPLETMPATDARVLDNWFPEPGRIRLRYGSRVHCSGIGSGDVGTIREYWSGQTRKLIAAGGGKIYDATDLAGSPTELASGFTANRWQTVQYRDTLIFVNGADTPQKYNGTTVTNAVYTGVSTPANLINVSSYRSRLYFVEKNTLKVWYSANVDEITGALTEFNLASLFPQGSRLVYAGTFNKFASGETENYFVAVSDSGHMAVYAGSYPGGADWALIGIYTTARPLGYRAFCHLSTDLLVANGEGIFPLSSVGTEGQSSAASRINDKIAANWTKTARDNRSIDAWELVYHNAGNMLIANVPQGSGTYHQHVQNTLTNAWCRFTGWNARTWGTFNDKLYYGDGAGRIIEADVGRSDQGVHIEEEIKLAFVFLGGDTQSNKRMLLAKPSITGRTNAFPLFECETDNKTRAYARQTIEFTNSAGWDSGQWDEAQWAQEETTDAEWQVVYGIGRSHSFKHKGRVKNAELVMNGLFVVYEPGGII